MLDNRRRKLEITGAIRGTYKRKLLLDVRIKYTRRRFCVYRLCGPKCFYVREQLGVQSCNPAQIRKAKLIPVILFLNTGRLVSAVAKLDKSRRKEYHAALAEVDSATQASSLRIRRDKRKEWSCTSFFLPFASSPGKSRDQTHALNRGW